MVNCIIIDDEIEHIENLASLLLNFKNLKITKVYCDSQKALEEIKSTNNRVDILFLDIKMPGINGIQLSQLLVDRYRHLIFVTAHSNFAFEAFELNASGYLLKPFSALQLRDVIIKFLPR